MRGGRLRFLPGPGGRRGCVIGKRAGRYAAFEFGAHRCDASLQVRVAFPKAANTLFANTRLTLCFTYRKETPVRRENRVTEPERFVQLSGKRGGRGFRDCAGETKRARWCG